MSGSHCRCACNWESHLLLTQYLHFSTQWVILNSKMLQTFRSFFLQFLLFRKKNYYIILSMIFVIKIGQNHSSKYLIIFVIYIYKNWVKLILLEIVLKNRSQSFATFRYKLTHYALECTCKYMVGPSHKVSSSRRETDMRQMSFRTWTLQLIKCLNGVGKFHLLWNASHVFHNEYFLNSISN